MSNIVFEALEMAPRQKKRSGQNLQFNCPACIHQNGGHRPDSRWRGGATILPGNRFVYHCHNCQFKTGWTPGGLFSRKVADLLGWCGISAEIIRDISFLANEMRYHAQNGHPRVTLPDGLMTCQEWADADCTDSRFLDIATFLQSFEQPYDLNGYYWTPDDNGMALDGYIISINGDLTYPTGWYGFPYCDPSQPYRTHKGIEPEPDDDVTEAELADHRRRHLLDDPMTFDDEAKL